MAGDERKVKRGDYGAVKRSKKGGYGATKQRKEGRENFDMSSPVMQAFSIYQKELDSKHDKYERIVKLSRDITIESKRIIFLLHRITGESNKSETIQEASDKLLNIQKNLLTRIAEELASEDLHCFLNAFTAGLQEYIEAVAFLVYVQRGQLVTKKELMKEFMTLKKSKDKNPQVEDKTIQSVEEATSAEKLEESSPSKELEKTDVTNKTDGEEPSLSLDVPPTEFILGLADFTGELMRLCVNSIGNGDLELPFEVVDFLRQIFDGFQLIGNQSGRELNRKVRVLRQSLRKVENVCYTLQVRGSEIPQHMLLDVIHSTQSQRDSEEGIAHAE